MPIFSKREVRNLKLSSIPFDLKTTYLPKDYDVEDAIKNPKNLAKWMYENQGAQRFGADNRLFVVLLDKNNPQESWKHIWTKLITN
jgi:hypothetical protein